jgi:hypothetical protein
LCYTHSCFKHRILKLCYTHSCFKHRTPELCYTHSCFTGITTSASAPGPRSSTLVGLCSVPLKFCRLSRMRHCQPLSRCI